MINRSDIITGIVFFWLAHAAIGLAQPTGKTKPDNSVVTGAAFQLDSNRVASVRALYGGETNWLMEFRPHSPSGAKEWKAEAVRLSEGRDRLVAYILQQSVHERDPEKKAALAFLLGEYRATEASSFLVGMISFESPDSSEENRLPLWGKYPACDALIKIGAPSVPALIKRLESETDATAVRLGALVLNEVYGPKVAVIVLEEASSKLTDQKRKENLDAIQEVLRRGRSI